MELLTLCTPGYRGNKSPNFPHSIPGQCSAHLSLHDCCIDQERGLITTGKTRTDADQTGQLTEGEKKACIKVFF